MNCLKVVLIILSACGSNHAHKFTPKIIDGQSATRGQFPFYALLQIYIGESMPINCGGILISADFILTCGHCLMKPACRASVYLGIWNTKLLEQETDIIAVEANRFHIYPFHVDKLHWNDIALIHLPRPAMLNEYIQPIRLPSDCSSNIHLDVIVMGHGRTSIDGISPTDYLKYAHLQTVPIQECRTSYKFLLFRKSVICAKPYEGSRQSAYKVFFYHFFLCDLNLNWLNQFVVFDKLEMCFSQGDSGSALIRAKDNALIGVVSFGKENVNNNQLQGFTNILSYQNWIYKVTGIELPKC